MVGIGWLLVAAYYVPWAYAIGRQTLSGTHFPVGAWTIATPFVILALAPVGAVLTWGSWGAIGRAFWSSLRPIGFHGR